MTGRIKRVRRGLGSALVLRAPILITGCAPMPKWINDVISSTLLGNPDPAHVEAARADPDYVGVIERAVLSGAAAPDHIRFMETGSIRGLERGPLNLGKLLADIDWVDRRPEHLALARLMFETDPEHYGWTLASVACTRPIDECEAEVLRLAFDNGASPGRRIAREAAATRLVERLGFDAPQLPRALPAGMPALEVATDAPLIVCFQHCLRACYGVGDLEEELAAIEACLKDDTRRSPNDHDAGNCDLILARLRQGGGPLR